MRSGGRTNASGPRVTSAPLSDAVAILVVERELRLQISLRLVLLDASVAVRHPACCAFCGSGVFAGGMASRAIIASWPTIRAVSAYTEAPDP